MSTSMNQASETCPDCGRELPPDSPQGLCPKCLAAIAMGVREDELPIDDSDSAAAVEAIGSTVGPYRLLEQIGEGGFGVVYMAEQRAPVTRKVALKIIKLGMDTRQVIARFEAERQALAMMDHPNIARVLDAGATHSGRPYFVMELVRGIPITRFCDEKKLPVRQRLELFFDVCAGVQHAHQKGIIHRDLKPGNVLAAMNDDKPLVKIIDFGIAKATGQKLTARTLFTQFHQFVGTPSYMSPEQAQLNATDVDTRSDIYALGVLLYELLTGRTPFDMEELVAEGHEAIFRLVREVDPPRPSTMMSGLTREERTAAARARRDTPEKLHGLLRGDLDRVVMKALEKDRQRRYETANALAQDVRRFLSNQPVTAVAPSPLYKLRKFVRRNWIATAAAAVVVVSLGCGLALALSSYAREHDARTTAEAERQEADAQRRKAKVNEHRMRLEKYAADMRLAQLALDDSDQGFATSILASHVPSGDDTDLRGWEWRYLRSQILDDALISRQDSEVPIVDISINSDGTLLALGRMTGSIEILDAFTLERLRTLQTDSTTGAAAVAFVPGGDLLATTVAHDPEIKLWDTGTWSVARGLPRAGDEGSERLRALACSPDGRRLATAVKREVVRVYSVKDGHLELEEPGEGPLAFSPGGHRFAFKREGRVIVTNLDSGGDPLEIEGGSVAFSPGDGSMLAVASGSVITLRNSRTGEAVLPDLEGHRAAVGTMVFVDEGKTLVSLSDDRTIRVWNLGSGETTAVLKGSLDQLWGLTAVPDGDHVITAAKDGTVSRWRYSVPPVRNEPRLLPEIRQVVSWYGPDETMIARTDDGSFALYDWRRLSRVQRLDRLGTGMAHVVWSPRKQLLVAFPKEGDRMLVWSRQGGIIATPEKPEKRARDEVFFGDLFLTLDRDQNVSAWDTDTWERADDRASVWKAIFDDFRKERDRFWGLQRFTVSPDERMVAIWSGKGGILWYSLEDGTRLAAELVHREWPCGFAFSADGTTAASASTGARVVLWRTDPPTRIDTIRGGASVALSPDGSRLITGRNWGGPGPTTPIRLWDVTTRRQLLSLGSDDELGNPAVVGFLPDGNGIYAETRKGLHVWRAPTLAEIDRRSVGGE